MHYSSLRSKILIIKRNIWTNRPVHGLLACYKRSYRILFFTIFWSQNGPSWRLNNNRNTSALVQERGKTPPTNVNPPPPPAPPPPYLSWRKPHFRPGEPPDHPSPSHYTSRFPCFLSVSSSGSFPKYVLWFCDHYPSLMFILIYIFFCLLKCRSFFLISR